MKVRSLLLVSTMLAAIFASQAAFAADRSATYVAGAGGRISADQAPVGYGGYRFPAAGDPTHVRVVDVSGTGVGFNACQELPGTAGELPNICGDGDDVDYQGCSTTGFIALPASFQPGIAVTVFIRAIDAVGSCEGAGTVGTITLRTL